MALVAGAGRRCTFTVCTYLLPMFRCPLLTHVLTYLLPMFRCPLLTRVRHFPRGWLDLLVTSHADALHGLPGVRPCGDNPPQQPGQKMPARCSCMAGEPHFFSVPDLKRRVSAPSPGRFRQNRLQVLQSYCVVL